MSKLDKVIEAAPKGIKINDAEGTTLEGLTITRRKKSYTVLKSPASFNVTVRDGLAPRSQGTHMFRHKCGEMGNLTRCFTSLVEQAIKCLADGEEFVNPYEEEKPAPKARASGTKVSGNDRAEMLGNLKEGETLEVRFLNKVLKGEVVENTDGKLTVAYTLPEKEQATPEPVERVRAKNKKKTATKQNAFAIGDRVDVDEDGDTYEGEIVKIKKKCAVIDFDGTKEKWPLDKIRPAA